MTSIALASFIDTPDGRYQNFAPGKQIKLNKLEYNYLGFIYQGATKNRTGDNLEAALILANNKISMDIAIRNVKKKRQVIVSSCVVDRENETVERLLCTEYWVAATLTYDPEQIEVVLSSAIDAVGTNAPLRVLRSKDVGRLPSSAQITNS